MPAARRILPTLLPALKQILFQRWIFVAAIVALATGLLLPRALNFLLPPAEPLMPFAVLASSFIIDLLGLALLLSWLPSSARHEILWLRFGAWLGSMLIVAVAFAGLLFGGAHDESLRTFAALWLLFAAQAAVVAALHALLRIVLVSNTAAIEATLLIAAVAVTALFWSREPIQGFSRSGSNDPASASRMADGVMKLSPPMAVAGAWYQESNAARAPHGSGDHRFDLVRAPLTYEIWIGSYQAIPYPQIFPAQSPDGFRPGLVLALLAWGLPLLLLGDVLLLRSRAV